MDNTNSITKFENASAHLLKTLADLQYGKDTITNYRRVLDRIRVYMKQHNYSCYTENIGNQFVEDHLSKGLFSPSYSRALRIVVHRLNDVYFGEQYTKRHEKPSVILSASCQEILENYLFHCRQKGNHENTIKNKRRFCTRFLDVLSNLGLREPAEMDASVIVQACLLLTDKGSYNEVRQFLAYLAEAKAIRPNLSHIVPRYIRPVKLPSVYSPIEIQRIEHAVNQTTALGIRDHTILLLASRLGMRAGDIVNLKLDNLDFQYDRIQFCQQKTGNWHELPFVPEIKHSIVRYLKFARPSVDSEFVFICSIAPYTSMTTSAVRRMLKNAFVSAGVNFENKKHGTHSLRASLASSLVNDDIPYESVRKILGHTDPRSIAHYARIDLEKLRLYALDAPPPSGNFEKQLYGRDTK